MAVNSFLWQCNLSPGSCGRRSTSKPDGVDCGGYGGDNGGGDGNTSSISIGSKDGVGGVGVGLAISSITLSSSFSCS